MIIASALMSSLHLSDAETDIFPPDEPPSLLLLLPLSSVARGGGMAALILLSELICIDILAKSCYVSHTNA